MLVVFLITGVFILLGILYIFHLKREIRRIIEWIEHNEHIYSVNVSLKIAMLPQYGQRICFCFIKIHLAYVFYTYIVRKQVMNSHRMGIETTPRFGLNGTKWQKI